jgi:hypothetical protein
MPASNLSDLPPLPDAVKMSDLRKALSLLGIDDLSGLCGIRSTPFEVRFTRRAGQATEKVSVPILRGED